MVRDEKTDFALVFFHARGDYLERILPPGARRLVSGKVESFDGLCQMVHPDHILDPAAEGDLPQFEPVYPLTAGVTQKLLYKAVGAAIKRVPDLAEWLDGPLAAREGWPDWSTAVKRAHAPQTAAALAAEGELLKRSQVRLIGACEGVQEHYYAISTERKVMHPLVQQILKRT